MKNKTTQGSGNKNLVSFGKAHSNIEDYKKQFQQSYLNIICKSINLQIILQIVMRQIMSPKKVDVQTTWIFRLQKIAQAVIKLMSHAEVLKDMCATTEWYPFVIFLARVGYLFFNEYLRLPVN
jgi:hypothetical protein